MTDPATTYARGVVDGRIVASSSVVLACRRHLADLETATEQGLVWHPEAAIEVCEFFAEVLRLPDGDGDDQGDPRPFVLAPWEIFVAGAIFGWRTVDGHSRFRVAYLEIGKGSGKTAFAAGLLLYRLLKSPAGSQHYCAAVAQHQAKLAFTDCVAMVLASPALIAAIEVRVGSLVVRATGASLRPISSEKRGLDGKRVHSALIDEVHEANETVVTKLRLGTKGNRDALILETTNAGFNRESICFRHHEHSRNVLTGATSDSSWFAFVCHLDACESCAARGAYQPTDDCADCDDWQTEGPHWLKANPGLDTAVHWNYLREAVREAVSMPSQRSMVRRLNFCQWTSAASVWLAPEAWNACADRSLTPESMAGRACFLGIDLSSKIDLSAVTALFAEPIAGASDTGLNLRVDTLTWFWMPSNTLRRRGQEDGADYTRWASDRSGWLMTTAGDLVDHDVILAFVLDLAKRYNVRGIGVDQAGATAMVTRLQRELGEQIVTEIPQGFRHLSEPTKQLEALVIGQQLRHPGADVMGWNIANLAIEENAWREIRPVKTSQRARIDGAVSLILALAMQLRSPVAATEPDYQMFFLGGRR